METVNLVNTLVKAVEPKAPAVAVVSKEPITKDVLSADKAATSRQELVDLNEPDKQALEDKVSELSNFVQNIQRGIQFSVDDESGHSVITVTDKESGEVIRTFPSEEMLAISAYLSEKLAMQDDASRGLLVNSKA
jgi:flagellar protein FlaG